MTYYNQIPLHRVENYCSNCANPNNYENEVNTYVVDPTNYYAPPWPANRTRADMVLQKRWFNIVKELPDFLNYSNGCIVEAKDAGRLDDNSPYCQQKENRKSIFS